MPAEDVYNAAVAGLGALMINLTNVLERCGKTQAELAVVLKLIEKPVTHDMFHSYFVHRQIDIGQATAAYATLHRALWQATQAIADIMRQHRFDAEAVDYELGQAATLAQISSEAEFATMLREEQDIRNRHWPD